MLNSWWPPPLDIVLRPDCQQLITSSDRLLKVLYARCVLAPVATDLQLFEKLVSDGFPLFAAIVLKVIRDDFLCELQIQHALPNHAFPNTVLRLLERSGVIDEESFRILQRIEFATVNASALLGTPAPYNYPTSLTKLCEALMHLHERLSVRPRNSICRDHDLWMQGLRDELFIDYSRM
jgi:hypothetical protein